MSRPRAVACSEFFHQQMGRRAFLKVGGLGLAGLTLPNLLRAEEKHTGKTKATAKSVILLFQFGGPSHIDTFDPKPKAPAEIRGEFKPIATKVPGIEITEIFPKTAQHADKYSV